MFAAQHHGCCILALDDQTKRIRKETELAKEIVNNRKKKLIRKIEQEVKTLNETLDSDTESSGRPVES